MPISLHTLTYVSLKLLRKTFWKVGGISLLKLCEVGIGSTLWIDQMCRLGVWNWACLPILQTQIPLLTPTPPQRCSWCMILPTLLRMMVVSPQHSAIAITHNNESKFVIALDGLLCFLLSNFRFEHILLIKYILIWICGTSSNSSKFIIFFTVNSSNI